MPLLPRSSQLLWSSPAGFYNAWRHGGFDERVLSKLEEAVAELQADESDIRFYITGSQSRGS